MKQVVLLLMVFGALLTGFHLNPNSYNAIAQEDELEPDPSYDDFENESAPNQFATSSLDDVATATENNYVIFNVLANDRKELFGYDRNISIESVSSPLFGEANVNSDNTITYTPSSMRMPSGTAVSDSFQYFAVVEPDDESSVKDYYNATVRVDILQTNDVPIVTDTEYIVTTDRVLESPLRVYDFDGDQLAFSVVSSPMFGQVEIDDETAKFRYEPYSNYTGLDSFSFVASDGVSTSEVAKITLSVERDPEAEGLVDDGKFADYPFDQNDEGNGDDEGYVDDDESGDYQQQTPIQNDTQTANSTSSEILPIAIVGDDIEVLSGSQVILDGSSSYDPNGAPITYAWSQVSGPQIALNNSTSAIPMFNAPNVESQTIMTFNLTVSNGQATSEPSYVIVNVNPIPDVEIDILPNEEPNNVNTNKPNANVSVGIIGSSILLDEAVYDIDSFAFGPNSATAFYSESADFNNDGIDDLIAYFYVADTGLADADTVACLTGNLSLTYGDVPFSSCDSISITNKND